VVVGQVSWNSSASKRFGRGQLKLPLVNHRPRLYWPEAHGAEVAFVVVVVVGALVVVVGATVLVGPEPEPEKHCINFLQSSFAMHFKLSSCVGPEFPLKKSGIAASQSLSFTQVAAWAMHGFEQTKIWEQSAFLKHALESPPFCNDIKMFEHVVSPIHA
jgi:hypothetical protein